MERFIPSSAHGTKVRTKKNKDNMTALNFTMAKVNNLSCNSNAISRYKEKPALYSNRFLFI